MYNDFDKNKIYTLTYDMENEITLLKSQLRFSLLLNEIDSKAFNRAMTYVEIKSSNAIESIHSTLHDVSIDLTSKTKEVRPMNIGSYSEIPIRQSTFDKIALGYGHNSDDRHKDSFGIYETKNGKSKRIYKPIIDKELLKKEVKEFWELIFNGCNNVSDAIKHHIHFEKLHPYSDGNGRIGRFLLECELVKYFNDSLNVKLVSVLPLSSLLNQTRNEYYLSLDLHKDSINFYFTALSNMFDKMTQYINEVKKTQEAWVTYIMGLSTKMKVEWAKRIAGEFMFTQEMAVNEFGISRQTAQNIFEKLNDAGLYNIINSKGKTFYFNIEIEETLIEIFELNK